MLSVSQNHSFVLSPSNLFYVFGSSPSLPKMIRVCVSKKKKDERERPKNNVARALSVCLLRALLSHRTTLPLAETHTQRWWWWLCGGGVRRDETKGNARRHHLRRTTTKKYIYISRRSTYPQFENVAFHLDQKNADGEQSKRHEASHHVHRGPARHRVADRRGKPNQGALQGEHLFLSLRLSLSLFCKRAFSRKL